MSEESPKIIEALQQENNTLKQQMAANSQGVQGLLAQLDAHKQSLNEALNVGLNLRTNLIMFQKQNEQLVAKIQEQEKQINSLNQQLTDATAKIASLEQAAAVTPDSAAQAA